MRSSFIFHIAMHLSSPMYIKKMHSKLLSYFLLLNFDSVDLLLYILIRLFPARFFIFVKFFSLYVSFLSVIIIIINTKNTCLAEPREARGRVYRGSKLWWRLHLCMRLFAVPLRLL